MSNPVVFSSCKATSIGHCGSQESKNFGSDLSKGLESAYQQQASQQLNFNKPGGRSF